MFKNKNNVFLHLLDYLLLTLNIYFFWGGGGIMPINRGKKPLLKKTTTHASSYQIDHFSLQLKATQFLSQKKKKKGNSILEILIRIQYLSNLCLLLFRKDEITSLQKQKIKIKMSRRRRRRRNHERIYISTVPPLRIRLT